MVNNNSNLLTVVWVAIAVAIVASIATASITGDTIKVINSKFARNEVYTKAEVDNMLKSVATNQGVLDMLRAYDLGNCGFMEVPRYSDLSSSYGLQYRQADSNGDGVTTGIEWASSMGSTCLYGFQVGRASAPEGVDYITTPIGCAGGPTLDDLRERVFPQSEEYLICSATKK